MTYANKTQTQIKHVYSVQQYARDATNHYCAVDMAQLMDEAALARQEGNHALADRILEGLPEIVNLEMIA